MSYLLKSVIVVLSLALPPTLGTGADGERDSRAYEPLYELNGMEGMRGSLLSGYLRAYNADTQSKAIVEWKRFLEENAARIRAGSFEDATDLMLIIQAHHELLRLYYLVEQTDQADRLLRETAELAPYAAPEPSEAKRWCRKYRYCDP